MPTKFCTGNVCCNNHKAQNPREKLDCKEFVIIGNGPSGIVLSYMLSGHWPYYVGQSQDEFLHARLMVDPHLSLVQQDLQFLSEGLEGRSNYPVALLLDALQKPEADLGLKNPSLLEWRQVPEARVDHVVLGRGGPGGIWQSIDGDMLTVSLGGWMELPDLSMSQWQGQDRASVATVSSYYQDYVRMKGLEDRFRNFTMVTGVKQVKCTQVQCVASDTGSVLQSSCDLQKEEVFCFDNEDYLDDVSSACSSMTRRRSLSSTSFESTNYGPSPAPPSLEPSHVETNYCDTIDSSGLSVAASYDNWDPIINPSLFGFSRQQSMDTEVVQDIEDMIKCNTIRRECQNHHDTLFEVTGYQQLPTSEEVTPFKYLTKNVVLATGQADTPNNLNVPGEHLPFVLHKLSQLTHLVKTGDLTQYSDPVVIVGAGLSAADAIIAAQSHSVPIVHVFRKQVRDPNLIFSRLPSKLYPEYHNVHKMMAGEATSSTSMYQPLQQTRILEISQDKKIRMIRENNQEVIVKASYVLVLIGSLANLSFLGDTADKLGLTPGVEISKDNPVDVDVFTHQCTAVPGLFAMGPLIGDNFVRFIQGGALAITNYAQQKKEKERKDSEGKLFYC